MAGEIQLNSTTMATESSGSITAELDTIRPNTSNGSLTLQGDSSDAGVTGLTIDSSGNATFAQTISGGTIGSSVVFPAGHIIQSQSTFTNNFSLFTASTPALISGFNQNITVKVVIPKCLSFLFLSGTGKGSNTSLLVDITESTTSLDETLTEISGYTSDTANGFDQTTLFFEHSHSQSAGTSLTYTPKFASAANSSGAFINNYNSADGQAYSYILVQELMV